MTNLTLLDFYKDERLANLLPLFNYNGKVGKKAKENSIYEMVCNYTKISAQKYYNPLVITKSKMIISVNGKLNTTYNTAYNGIVKALNGRRRLLAAIIANDQFLNLALKEDMQRKGEIPKLRLRANSKEQILKMNSNQLYGLLNDIVNNIVYSGNYPKTARVLGNKIGVTQNASNQKKWR